MHVDCQYNHERAPMHQDHANKQWMCIYPNCGQLVGNEEFIRAVQPEYMTLEARSMMDYEIVGIMMENGKLFVEYPRRKYA